MGDGVTNDLGQRCHERLGCGVDRRDDLDHHGVWSWLDLKRAAFTAVVNCHSSGPEVAVAEVVGHATAAASSPYAAASTLANCSYWPSGMRWPQRVQSTCAPPSWRSRARRW